MSETYSEEIRQEAVNSCLEKMTALSTKEKMFTLNCFKFKRRNYVL